MGTRICGALETAPRLTGWPWVELIDQARFCWILLAWLVGGDEKMVDTREYAHV